MTSTNDSLIERLDSFKEAARDNYFHMPTCYAIIAIVKEFLGEPEQSGIECVAAPSIAVADEIQKKAASPAPMLSSIVAAYQRAFNAIDDLMEYRGMDKEKFTQIATKLTDDLMGESSTRKDEERADHSVHCSEPEPLVHSPAQPYDLSTDIEKLAKLPSEVPPMEGEDFNQWLNDEKPSDASVRKCMICGYGRYCNNCVANGDNHKAMFPTKELEQQASKLPPQAVPYEKQHPELRGLPPEMRPSEIPSLIQEVFSLLSRATIAENVSEARTLSQFAYEKLSTSMNTHKPVTVSLEQMAIVASQWFAGKNYDKPMWDDLNPIIQKEYIAQVKAILDAAGVKYE